MSKQRSINANSFHTISSLFRDFWMLHPMTALREGQRMQQFLDKNYKTEEPLIELPPFSGMIVSLNESSSAASSGLDSAPKGSVAIVNLKGTMLKYGTMCSYGTEEIAEYMLEVAAHKNVGSIVLDIDSGGGSVDAIAPMLQAIEKIQADGIPVIASVDLCASAAYYTASKCDKIIASNDISAEIGSIGVMMSFTDVKPFYEKAGYKFHTIYADPSNYKNRPFELALEGKYDEIKKEELNPLAIKFQDDVKANRGSKLKQETEGILNGRMFFANTAKEVGLIDQVGTIETAIKEAAAMATANTLNKAISEYNNPK